MSEPPPQSPPAAEKPTLAPGVKPPIMLPNAVKPSGPGLAAAAAPFSAGQKSSLGGPRPRLRASEPTPIATAASYKVPVSSYTGKIPAFPTLHLIISGTSATFAVTAAVFLFLKL